MDTYPELLRLADEPEVGDLQELINKAAEFSIQLKYDVKEQMEMRHVKFMPIIVDNETFLLMGNKLAQEVEDLQYKLETKIKGDIANLTEELKNISESLIESTVIVEDVNKLLKVDDDLKKGERDALNGDYCAAAQHICAALKSLNEECNDLDFLDIYQGITETLANYHITYCGQALDQWRKCIEWTQIEGDGKNEKLITSLSISDKKKHLQCLLKTLELYDAAHKEIATFSDKFLKLILTPVITSEVTIRQHKTANSMEAIIVTSSSKNSPPLFAAVVENLLIVFNYLHDLLDLETQEQRLISLIGEYVLTDFLSLFVDHCLTEAIPTKREHLVNYTAVLGSITELQTLLYKIGFLPASNTDLDEYCGNVETLFLNKTVEQYLDKARKIMKKDLHDVTQVGIKINEKLSESLTINHERTTLVKTEESIDLNELSLNIFQFPKCSISTSTIELLELVKSILFEGVRSDKKTCVQLFQTARNIIFLYKDITPEIHSKLLRDIPQYAAILHNNLMYLAHRSMTVEHEMKPFVPLGTSPTSTCFTDMVLPLRNVASEVFSAQVVRQQNALLDLLKDSGLSSLCEYEVLSDRVEKAVKQCIRQLTLLKIVWENVLPSNLYAQVMGDLSGVFIEEIISRVISATDMRATVATQLAACLCIVEQQLPTLFTEQNEVYQHVRRWSAFKELLRVLSASLAEIGERWADGKGPLAAEFTPDQVRQMIRALFQLSDRRAAVLSRIK